MLEVMIALTILSVGILGIGAVQLTATKLSGDSRVRTQASFLAQQQVERMRPMDMADLIALAPAPGFNNDPGNPIDPTPGDGQAVTFDRRWQVQQNVPEAGVTTVTVEVDYLDNLGATRTVRLQTMRAGP
jgi:Tfp pilus assembly protein PilV